MAIQEIKIPDLGGASSVDVIEILVKPGDKIKKEDSLVTLEGDKASMDVPSPIAGTVKEIKIKTGTKANEGDVILIAETADETAAAEKTSAPEKMKEEPKPPAEKATEEKTSAEKPKEMTEQKIPLTAETEDLGSADLHAGPAVRRLAREIGISLQQIKGSGPKHRILVEDLQNYVKAAIAGKSAAGISVAPAPQIDFSKFGEVETKALTKIKKLTGINTHRSWVTVPHVTQFDEADITEMEAFRNAKKEEAEKQGFKLTPIVFLMKAIVRCLHEFPNFNSSLDASGENIILKKYFHIGVAVDTPNGLVVPVIRDVDRKGLFDLAHELKNISTKARDKGLLPGEMQGGCFTISSLGGISGTAFTPIVNSPEVAILGVSKAQMKPVYQHNEFVPRLMLPLSLSYDHRVVDGAEAARFTGFLVNLLGDIRQLLF